MIEKLVGMNTLSIDIDIARPGGSARITPVKDVIEPRVKLKGQEIYSREQ